MNSERRWRRIEDDIRLGWHMYVCGAGTGLFLAVGLGAGMVVLVLALVVGLVAFGLLWRDLRNPPPPIPPEIAEEIRRMEEGPS